MFRLQGREVRGRNLPDFQVPICSLIFFFRISPFSLRVVEWEEYNFTPRKTRWSVILRYGRGLSSCCKTPFHLPKIRILHFSLLGSLCSLQPDDLSYSQQALSTNRNSHIVVISGLQSSRYPCTLYLVSTGGRGVGWSGKDGQSTGR